MIRRALLTYWPVPFWLAWVCLPLLRAIPSYWLTLADYAGIAAIIGIGLVVLTGMAGITSFGQAAFMGFAAYATALLTTQTALSPWLALPVALLASGLGALVLGAVTLRLSGHYLALGTIAWSVAIFYLFGNLDLLGRNDGLSGIPPLTFRGVPLLDSGAIFPVIWLAAGLAMLLTVHLLDSRVGRAIRALRGGAAAAASFGVELPAMRLLAFTYAAVLAGLAGWLYAHMQRAVSPTPFGLNAGIEYLLMAVLGGLGRLPGAVLGAALVTLVNDRLQDILPRLLGNQGNYETIVFGALLVLGLQLAPQGLWPLLTSPIRLRRTPHPGGGAPLPSRTLPEPGATVLEASELVKKFGGLTAVSGLSLELRAGRIMGLIGPNGAGKKHHLRPADRRANPKLGLRPLPGRAPRRPLPPRHRPPRHRPFVPAREVGARHVGAGERGARSTPARPGRAAARNAPPGPARGGPAVRRGPPPARPRRPGRPRRAARPQPRPRPAAPGRDRPRPVP